LEKLKVRYVSDVGFPESAISIQISPWVLSQTRSIRESGILEGGMIGVWKGQTAKKSRARTCDVMEHRWCR
jgi:hypothetical protein